MTHVDLYSGIGGFSIAAEAVGYKTIAFAEIDPAANIVLDYWWPEVHNLGNVETLGYPDEYYHWVVQCSGCVDLLTAGVPCQPTSHVGLRLGSADPRWQWPNAIRAMRLFRPWDAVFENPPAILTLEGGRAFNGIVSELVALGYDLWWDIFPAAAFGAGHLRERLIIVATDSMRRSQQQHARAPLGEKGRDERRPEDHGPQRLGENVADGDLQRRSETGQQRLLEGPTADHFRGQSTSSDSPATHLADDNHDQAERRSGQSAQPERGLARSGRSRATANGAGERRRKSDDATHTDSERRRSLAREIPVHGDHGESATAHDAERAGLEGHERERAERPRPSSRVRPVAPPDIRGRVNRADWWSEAVTGVPVLVHGLPNKLVEAVSRCTGNAIVPQTIIPLLRAIHDRRVNRLEKVCS